MDHRTGAERSSGWIGTRRALGLGALLLLLTPSCFNDTAYLVLSFAMTDHPQLTKVELGSAKQDRLLFSDHDLSAMAGFRTEERLADFDDERAERVRSGVEKLPMGTHLRFSPVNEVAGAELVAVTVERLSVQQGGTTTDCEPTGSGADGKALVLADAGGPVPREIDGGRWSSKRTKPVDYQCELAYAPFELIVRYRLEREGGAEPISRTVKVPFEPAKMEYRKLNAAFAGCMSA